MNNDIKRALLGDKEAAKQLAKAKVLLPCPICGNRIDYETEVKLRMLREFKDEGWMYMHFCDDQKLEKPSNITIYGQSEEAVLRGWNTRTPIRVAETEREVTE